MSDFSTRIDAFLAETFRLNPTFATAIGEHHHDDRWPDLSAAGRAERLALIDALAGRVRRRDRPDGRRSDRPRPADRRARGRAGLPRPSCARTPGTRSSGSISSATACSRSTPASSLRWPTAWPRPPGASRACRRSSRRPRRRWSGRPIGRSVGSRPRPRSSSCPGSTSSSTTRWPRPRRPPRPTRPSPRSCRG